MTKVWKTGDLLDAAHMNDLAQISDVGTPGTPTGDALKAALDASYLPYSGIPKSDLSAFRIYLPEAHGAVGDGVTDDTTAVQAAINVCPAGGRLLLSRAYKVTGVTISASIKVEGTGGAISGGNATTMPTVNCGLVTSSATGVALTVAASGVVLRDFAVACTATTPTAGAGIAIAATAQRSRLDNVRVLGFYDDITLTSAKYVTFQNVHCYDPIRYGLYMNSDVGHVDVGDTSVDTCYFDSVYTTRVASAAIRWEGGGGPRIVNCKINAYYVTNGGFLRGIDAAVMDGGSTSDLLITGCSIENTTDRAISVTQLGTTGSFANIVITGNELDSGSCTYGVYVAGGSTVSFAKMTITGNVIAVGSTSKIHVDYCTKFLIGGNTISAGQTFAAIDIGHASLFSVAPNQIEGAPGIRIDSNCTAYNLERQRLRGGTLFVDSSAVATSAQQGNVVTDYSREIPGTVTSSVTWVTIFSFTPVVSTSGFIDFTATGKGSGGTATAGALAARWTYTRPSSGACTVAQVGTDTTVGTLGLDYQFETASVPGQVNVQVKLNAASSATGVGAKARLQLNGLMTQMVLS